MRMDELKQGFWGYKKESVYHYIVSMEERTSQKLAEKDEKLCKLEDQSLRRITELEASLESAREEIDRLRENQASVFARLLEAQRQAERLKDESDRREQKAQEDLKTAVQQQTQKLDVYSAKVRQLREAIRNMLREFDSEAGMMEQSASLIPSQEPDVSLRPLSQQSEAKAQEGELWKKLPSM